MADHGDADEENFEGADSGASKTFPKQCSALRKSEFVVIKGRPCKIVEMSTSKTGKHGHAKVHIVALDVFTNKKYEDICPSTHNMTCPNVSRTEYSVLQEEEGFLHLMDENGATREDLRCPPADTELGKDIAARLEKLNDGEQFMVSVLEALGEEQVIGAKAMQN